MQLKHALGVMKIAVNLNLPRLGDRQQIKSKNKEDNLKHLLHLCHYLQAYSISGRDAAAGGIQLFLVRWFLVIVWRWQHMCLFSESSEVL